MIPFVFVYDILFFGTCTNDFVLSSYHQTCSHGTACNFIHCFRNPGGDYEWADWDKPPPRYWVKRMAALYGYSDKSEYEMDKEKLEHRRMSRVPADTDRYKLKELVVDQHTLVEFLVVMNLCFLEQE